MGWTTIRNKIYYHSGPNNVQKPAKEKRAEIRRENIFQDGPYLITAVVCEKVLEEKDGVKTAVRMIDRFTTTIVGPEAPQTLPPLVADLTLLIRLKKGEAGHKHQLKIEFVDPFGQTQSTFSQTITFEGGPDRGIDFVLNSRMQFHKEGIYWLEVYIDEWRVTRIPLTVVYIIQIQRPGSETQKQPH